MYELALSICVTKATEAKPLKDLSWPHLSISHQPFGFATTFRESAEGRYPVTLFYSAVASF